MARTPIPTSSSKLARTALVLALTALRDERVRTQLRKAPAAARSWAEQRKAAAADGDGVAGTLSRIDPTQRFGQRGIERRLAALQRNVAVAFPDPSDPAAVAVYRAIDELDRAAAISATMPLLKRRAAHARISEGLDRLEMGLVEAVLPGDRDA